MGDKAAWRGVCEPWKGVRACRGRGCLAEGVGALDEGEGV